MPVHHVHHPCVRKHVAFFRDPWKLLKRCQNSVKIAYPHESQIHLAGPIANCCHGLQYWCSTAWGKFRSRVQMYTKLAYQSNISVLVLSFAIHVACVIELYLLIRSSARKASCLGPAWKVRAFLSLLGKESSLIFLMLALGHTSVASSTSCSFWVL